MTPALNDKSCQEVVDAYTRFGSEHKAAGALNLSRNTLRSRLNEARRRGFTSGIESPDRPPRLTETTGQLEAPL